MRLGRQQFAAMWARLPYTKRLRYAAAQDYVARMRGHDARCLLWDCIHNDGNPAVLADLVWCAYAAHVGKVQP